MRIGPRLLLVSVAVIALPAVAGSAPVRLGAKVGLSVTSIHGDFADLIGPEYKTGLLLGASTEIGTGPIALALEVNYVDKGFRTVSVATDDQGNFVSTIDGRMKLRYLEVPVLARASLPVGGVVRPYLVLGPSFGLALGAKFESPGLPDRDYGDDLKAVDIGGGVGLGTVIGHGPYRLTVEGRYTSSFSDLWDISGNFESINHGFGFTVGVVH